MPQTRLNVTTVALYVTDFRSSKSYIHVASMSSWVTCIAVIAGDVYANRCNPMQTRFCAIFGLCPLYDLVLSTAAGFNTTPPEGAESRLCRLTAPEHRG